MPLQLRRYPVNWRAVARTIKEICDWTCLECGRNCRQNQRLLTVAHVWPESHAPDAEVVCVMVLCAPCHLRYDAPHTAARVRRHHRRHNMSLAAPWALSRRSELDEDDMSELAAMWPGSDYLLSLEDGIDHWAHVPVTGSGL